MKPLACERAEISRPRQPQQQQQQQQQTTNN